MCKKKHSQGGMSAKGLWGKVIFFITVATIIRNNIQSFGYLKPEGL